MRLVGLRAVGVLAVALAAGCTAGGEPPSPVPSSSAPPAFEAQVPNGVEIDEPPGGPGLAVGAARWTFAGGPLSAVTGASPAGDSVVLTGTSASPRRSSDPGGLAVVDAATGAVRWSLRAEDVLPAGRGGYWPGHGGVGAAVAGDLVVVPYSGTCSSECDHRGDPFEAGVAALSLADGRVRWQARLADREHRQRSVGVAGAGGTAVVAAVTGGDGRSRAVGLDPRTGEVGWELSGYLPTAVRGDAVVVVPDEDKGRGGGYGAADAATGRLRWEEDASDPLKQVTAFGDRLLAAWTRTDGTEVVDVADGSVRLALPVIANGCAVGGDAVACWLWIGGDPRLVTWRVGEDRPLVSRREVPAGQYQLTPSGALLGWEPGGPVHVYDRSANRLGDALPGVPLAVADDVAVFATPTGAALHPVR